ncbi:MAG: 30S ribosomal protein S12 methylthiotransferase RimO [Anaerovoracaceae bacterium]
MKIYIDTLGCPKNSNDSEGIAGICENAGIETTPYVQDADVMLVNTCGFINDAKRESIDRIFEMASCKNAFGDEKILIVSGCLSERYRDELYREMPEVDIFLGVNDYEKLPDMIKNFKFGERMKVFSCQPEKFTEFSARKTKDAPYTATLRIAEGCDNRCAYCVIPQIRGNYRSRPMDNIVKEAESLAEKGCRELILIAQDVTGYGLDLYGELVLPQLLRRLCGVEGIKWIRLMYCYEDKISDELIEVMASNEKICSYIDIPIQHISGRVLKAMRRRSTPGSIRKTIARLRESIKDIHIRTTLITGFPGESEEDFEELLEFVEEERFERLGVFAYSQEEGTPAGEMPDQLDEDVKTARADAIMLRQMEISREVNEEKKGKIFDVLVEGEDDSGAYTGRTQYDAPDIDNTVIFTAERDLRPGDMVRVKITDAFDYDLVGEMEE